MIAEIFALELPEDAGEDSAAGGGRLAGLTAGLASADDDEEEEDEELVDDSVVAEVPVLYEGGAFPSEVAHSARKIISFIS